MQKKELIKIIQEVVRLEIKKMGPEIVRNALLESLQPNTSSAAPKIHRPNISNLVVEETPVQLKENIVEQKPMKKFSTNPILNQVLNETRGGVPQEGADTGVSVQDLLANTPKEVLSENAEVQGVANALTRDYRSLLKAIDEKSKKHRPL
jgi:hypothetical protein